MYGVDDPWSNGLRRCQEIAESQEFQFQGSFNLHGITEKQLNWVKKKGGKLN